MEMIRKQRESDLDDVTRIWLTSNLGAHDFIPEEYWKGNLDAVRSAIGGAEVYVHEDDRGRIDGFIGLDGEFIEALHDISLAFRGSSNQRIIDVKASLKENKIIPHKLMKRGV